MMRINPYIAAVLVALVSGMSVLVAGSADQGLTQAEWLSAASAALTALLAALHLPTPAQGVSAPSKAEVVVVPVDSEDETT